MDLESAKEKIEQGKNLVNDYKNVISEKKNDLHFREDLKKKISKSVSKIGDLGTRASGTIGSFLADKDLLKHLESITNATSSIYDKTLDSEYLKTNIGGKNYRIFDGNHDIIDAWDKVKDTLPEDSFQKEILGHVSTLWKDMTTVKGLPLATVSRESFDSWVNKITEIFPGINKQYLYDLLSFDAYELLSTSLGAVSIIFVLKNEDQEKLAELLGSMGIISILSANPIMGLFVISTSAFAYTKKKMEFDKSAFGKSAAVTATSMAMFNTLGLPIVLELVIIGVVTNVLRKEVLDNKELHDLIKTEIDLAYKNYKIKT